MKLQSLMLRNSLLILTMILALPAFRAAAQSKPDSAPAAQAAAIPARITQAIDETQLVRLRGNVHPLARVEFDRGIVSDATPMKRMMLVLQRSPEQQAALSQLMDEQLSKDTLNFHKWLTPEQFGKQFGPADADIQTVTDWLARQGFQEIKVGTGRTVIEFSGNVGQVRNAFHTEIHQFNVTGESRQANVSDPQIPAALTPVVAGIVSLHNFPRKSFRHDAGIHTSTRDSHGIPQFTTTSGCGTNGTQPCYALGPADFAKIYNIPASLDGTGQQIAIVADSNINPNDAIAFRNLFGLTPATGPTVILNGPDPGISGPPLGDEGEADLDVQVAGMVAPKATIDLVVSEDTLTAFGIDLSALYIIDNNIAPVMSESFGNCEAGLGTTGNQFYNTLWEQAAAQGITVMIASGDPGSAGCDNFNTPTPASQGLAVSGFASTPFNVAVGGTDFDDVGTQSTFWSSTNGVGRESALGYIHEMTWNDSCAATATSTTLNTVCVNPTPSSLLNIVGGGGGPSSVYAKPAWQSGIIPNGIAAGDDHRYTPDVSLFASDGPQSMSFYLVCQADAVPPGQPPSCATSGSFSFNGAGGTSASSPAFAAIMALINQNNGRQGNANPVLYKMAATAGQSCNSSTTPLTGSTTCSFYDVTKGNNSVPCMGNSTNCSSKTTGTNGVLVSTGSATTPAWTTATGYDLATGLGSVNVTNLATQWPLAVGTFHSTTTSLTLNGGATVNITHGTAVTAKVTVTSTSSGTPTGDVALLAPTAVNGGIGDNTLSSGTVTVTGVILPGGSYNVNARYGGDTTFASSTSTPGVPVIVGKENSRLQYGIVTFSPTTGGIVSTNATSFVYGSPYILRMDILNSTTNVCQVLVAPTTTTGCAFDATGTVTIKDNGNPLDTGTFTINSAGSAEDQPIQLTGGSHALSATYSGDISYNPVTTPLTDTVTVSQAATQVVGLTASPTSGVTTATPVALTATLSSGSNSAVGTTGTVTFFNGGAQIGSPATVMPIAATATVGAGGTATLTTTFTSAGTKAITAQYNGDTNYAASAVSSAITVTVTQAQTGSFTVGGGAVPVTAGSSGMSTITVTPTGGFTSAGVAITCPTLPLGVHCAALSIPVPNANPATGQLPVSVDAPAAQNSMASVTPTDRRLYAAGIIPASGGQGWWTLSGITGLGAVILLLLPGRKRFHAALGLGLVCVLSFTLGCSGYGGGGGGGGPVATTTHITVTSATKAAMGGTFTFTTTVTGGTPTDQVQLLDGGVATGNPVAVSAGTATLTTAPLSTVGMHSITAHYAGDATYTQASSSGALNVMVTGTTQLPIAANPASSNANPTINLTIN
jgi:Pro-kumamolisin, activation domain/Bacterial Ig-like domain (group 3)